MKEYLQKESLFHYIDIHNIHHQITLESGSLAFTFCQVPIVFHKGKKETVQLHYSSGQVITRQGCQLSLSESENLFMRNGEIAQIDVNFE